MIPKSARRILAALACLAAGGCAGVARPMPAPPKPGAAALAPDDARHADLERELSLYSD